LGIRINKKHLLLFPGRNEKIGVEFRKIITDFGYSSKIILPTVQPVDVKKEIYPQLFSDSTKIIARSYGCFIILRALSGLPTFPGSVLFFNPCFGLAKYKKDQMAMRFRDSGAEKLQDKIKNGKYPVPRNLTIYTYRDDWQSDFSICEDLISYNKSFILKEKEGSEHAFPEKYLINAIQDFLTN